MPSRDPTGFGAFLSAANALRPAPTARPDTSGMALELLRDGEGCSLQEMARCLSASGEEMSAVLTGLQRQGLVVLDADRISLSDFAREAMLFFRFEVA